MGTEQMTHTDGEMTTNRFGVTETKTERHYRIDRYYAAKDGGRCAACLRILGDKEPVWRQEARRFTHGTATEIIPVCKECRNEWKRFEAPKPCEGGGRPVHQRARSRSFRSLCSFRCESRVAADKARSKRAKARLPRLCEQCGETFEPRRADSRYCSPACRQKAYRRRVVTDRECVTDWRFESRNATHFGNRRAS